MKHWWIRGLVVVTAALVGWVGYLSSQQFERSRRIESQVAELQLEAERVGRENDTLSQKIRYFSSQSFEEQEAKSKLGLKKPDETAVVIKLAPESPGTSRPSADNVIGYGSEIAPDMRAPIPNYLKWWNLFFSKPSL